MFGWLRERARDRIREAPFPERWQEYLDVNVRHYRYLSPIESEVLREDLRIFIREKHWEGCGGLVLTEEMQVTIAAQACLISLCLERKYYPNVLSVFVYPSAYRVRAKTVGPGGVVTEGPSTRLGEAWHAGPVVLSWSDVQGGGQNPEDGRNVVFHEFAHKLDMLNGASDGTPRLYDDEAYERWFEVMKQEWDELQIAARSHRSSFLDVYGATNAAELFAVATEAFFERSRQMLSRHPALYAVLKEYYRQDPAERIEAYDLEHSASA